MTLDFRELFQPVMYLFHHLRIIQLSSPVSERNLYADPVSKNTVKSDERFLHV